jgi:ubiquinone/menaquinone biosynthesis C-methylase UbiE
MSRLKRGWWKLVQFGFRLLYNEMAWTYDTVSRIVSLGQWRDWQRVALHHLDTPPGARILELAHGTGNLQIDLHAAGYRTAGLDLSRNMGHIAGHKLRRRGILPPLVRAQAQALPFPAQSFPAVISTFPTEFIADPVTLAEIYRVLEPGGRLVVVLCGVLTRGGIVKEALEGAYRATGQRSPRLVSVEDRLAAAGFRGHLFSEELSRSLVWLFVAEKPPTT